MLRLFGALLLVLWITTSTASQPVEPLSVRPVSFDHQQRPSLEAWQDLATQLGYTLELGEDVDKEHKITATATKVEPWVAALVISRASSSWVLLHADEKVVEVADWQSSSREVRADVDFSAGHRLCEQSLKELYGTEKGLIDRVEYLERIGSFLSWDVSMEEVEVDAVRCALTGPLLPELEAGANEFARLIARPEGGKSKRLQEAERAWATLKATNLRLRKGPLTLTEFLDAIGRASGVPVATHTAAEPEACDVSAVAAAGDPVSCAAALERALPHFGCAYSLVGGHVLVFGEDWEQPSIYDRGYAIYELSPAIKALVGGQISDDNRDSAARWHPRIEEALFTLCRDDEWFGTRVALAGNPADHERISWLLTALASPLKQNLAPAAEAKVSLKVRFQELQVAARSLAEQLGYRLWLAPNAEVDSMVDVTVKDLDATEAASLLAFDTRVPVSIDHRNGCVIVGEVFKMVGPRTPFEGWVALDTTLAAAIWREGGVAVPEIGEPGNPFSDKDKIGFHIHEVVWRVAGPRYVSDGWTIGDSRLLLFGPERDARTATEVLDLLGAKGEAQSRALSAQEPIWARLAEKRLSVGFNMTGLSGVATWIGKTLGENVIATNRALEICDEKELALDVNDLPAGDVIQAVCAEFGIGWRLVGNTVVFDLIPDEREKSVDALGAFATYDVSALLKAAGATDNKSVPRARAAMLATLTDELAAALPLGVSDAVACGGKIVVLGDMRVQRAAKDFLVARSKESK